MTKRLKDELETLSKWRTVIQDLPKAESAPTPTAQEDEPIYFARNGESAIWFKPSANSLDWYKSHEWQILECYTRPQSDEIRKAAEELFDGQFLDGCVITQSLAQKLGKLRAALDKK